MFNYLRIQKKILIKVANVIFYFSILTKIKQINHIKWWQGYEETVSYITDRCGNCHYIIEKQSGSTY